MIVRIHKRLIPDKSRKSKIIAMFIALFFGMPIFCDKIYASTGGRIKEPASLKVSEEDILSEEIQQLVMDLEYSETVARDFANMVMGWKNKQDEPHLIVWKRNLSESRNEYEQEKIDENILARNEIIKTQELNQKIRYSIDYNEAFSDLDDLILNKQANCLGLTQTFYILANSIGLRTKAINVFKTAGHELMSEEEKDQGHIACLVYLSDDKTIMSDLARKPYPMTSRPFQLLQEFNKNGRNYSIKRRNNPLRIHTRFQILDCNELVGTLHYNRGATFAKSEDNQNAINEATKSIELYPDNHMAYFSRGVLLTELRKYDKAISDYDKAIKLNPKHTKAYFNRGFTYSLLNQPSRAISDNTKVIELEPDFTDAYYLRGINYTFLGELEKAKRDLLKAVELNPELKEKVKEFSDQLELNLKFD